MLLNPTRRAVFLDRDGVINYSPVINGKPYPPENLAALTLLPGVPDALSALSRVGFLLIVITNQPDVAKGITSKETVETIHDYLMAHLPLETIRTCFHDDNALCDCRKPAPGAFFAVAELYGIDLANSYMIGDRWRDIEAGQRAGCKTIFIDYGYQEKQPASFDFRVQNLTEATGIILGELLWMESIN